MAPGRSTPSYRRSDAPATWTAWQQESRSLRHFHEAIAAMAKAAGSEGDAAPDPALAADATGHVQVVASGQAATSGGTARSTTTRHPLRPRSDAARRVERGGGARGRPSAERVPPPVAVVHAGDTWAHALGALDVALPAGDPRGAGAALRDLRELRGMAVEELADASGLAPAVVRSLEAGDWDQVGVGALAPAYLRTCARRLGWGAPHVSVDAPLRFDGTVRDARVPDVPAPLAAEPAAPGADAHTSERGGRLALRVVTPIVGVGLLLAAGSGLAGGEHSAPPPAPIATPTEEAASPTTVPAPLPPPVLVPVATSDGAMALASAPPHALAIGAFERTWVQVTEAGVVRFEGTIEPGAREELVTTRETTIVVGNPAGTLLTVGNVAVALDGDDQPVELRLPSA